MSQPTPPPVTQPDPASIPCAIAGALALALLGGGAAFAIGLSTGSYEKDPDIVMTMAMLFGAVGLVAGWFGGRAASKMIEPTDTPANGAVKIGSGAAGLGATIGGLCGLQFGALGCVLGGLIGAAAFGLIGAGLGVLFVNVKKRRTAPGTSTVSETSEA